MGLRLYKIDPATFDMVAGSAPMGQVLRQELVTVLPDGNVEIAVPDHVINVFEKDRLPGMSDSDMFRATWKRLGL